MSAFTTIYLTRQQARTIVARAAMDCDDDTLKRLADLILEPRLYDVSLDEAAEEYYGANPEFRVCL